MLWMALIVHSGYLGLEYTHDVSGHRHAEVPGASAMTDLSGKPIRDVMPVLPRPS